MRRDGGAGVVAEEVLVDRDPRHVALDLDVLVGEDELEPLRPLEQGHPARGDLRPTRAARPSPGGCTMTRSECSQTSDMASRSRASKAS